MKFLIVKVLLVCLLFFSLPVIILAQQGTIKGIIKDSALSKPVSDATIVLVNFQSGMTINSITNKNGAFVLNSLPFGDYSIQINFIGYKSYFSMIQLTGVNSIIDFGEINLKKEDDSLATVTVTAAKPFIIQSPNRIILNVSQSPIASSGNALDAIARGPGVIEQNGTITFRNKKVAILIDGKPSNLSGDDLKDMLVALPANTIDKIEIIPSPSSKYDAQGGSVINIKLIKLNTEGFNGNTTMALGSGKYLRYNSGINFNCKKSKINLGFSYNYVHNKQFYDNNSDRIVDTNSNILQDEYEIRIRNNHFYKLTFDYDINSRNSIGIICRGNSNFLDRSVSQQADLKFYKINNDTFSQTQTNGRIIVFNPTVNIFYKKKIDTTGKEFAINLDMFEYNKNWSDYYTTTYINKNNIEYWPQKNLQNTTDLLNNSFSIGIDYVNPIKNGKLELGLKSTISKTDNNSIWLNKSGLIWQNDTSRSNDFIYKENINALYFSVEKLVKQSWSINIGARLEQTVTKGLLVNSGENTPNNYTNLFPNLNIQFIKSLNNIFSFSYRKDIERFGYGVVNPFLRYISQYNYAKGNPAIQPELYHSFDISYTYKQFFTIGASYQNTQNLIVPLYVAGNNNSIISTVDNLGKSDLLYSYLNFNKTIFKIWNTNLSGGYGFIKINTGSASISNDKPTWGYLIQSNNTLQFSKGWNSEIYLSYAGPTVLGIYKIAALFNSGLGISKSVFKNKGSVKFSFTDVFNTQIQKSEINYIGVTMSESKKTESQFIQLSFNLKLGNMNISSKKAQQIKADELNKRISE